MTEKTFMRSSADCCLGGVCGGVAEYFEIPSWLVRVIWVLATVCLALFIGVLVYVLMWCFVPKNPSTKKIDPNTIDADYEVKN